MATKKTSMPVDEILAALVASEEGGRAMIAVRLGASESSLARWLTGRTRPHPDIERQIRSLAVKRGLMPDEAQTSLFQPTTGGAESTIRMALSVTLRQVREVLHSMGRLSSRHEALDEVAKLLFAHVISIDTGGPGINRELLSGPNAASSLRSFVEGVFRLHLPVSLAHEVTPADFHLRLKDHEQTLANSLIDCFGRLASPEIMRQMRDVGSADLVNDTFGQFLVDSFSDEKELGQYLTPPEVVRFMVRLGLHSMSSEQMRLICDMEAGEPPIILDPSCGVGSFLAETMRVLYGRVREQHGASVLPKWIARTMTKVLVGVDKSERMIRLALTNLAMFGAPTVNLHLVNALARHGHEGKTMDDLQGRAALILTNPPFGAEFDRSDVSTFRVARLWANGSASTIDSEILFMERYLDWLAPGGVLVAVVPDSILTNQGVFASLRRGLAPSMDIMSVISLPSATFAAAGTNTKTSILHIRKKVAEMAAPKVYFAICQDIGFDVPKRGAQRVRVKTERNDLDTVLTEVTTQQSPKIGCYRHLDPDEPRWDATFHAGLADSVMEKLDAKDGRATTLAHVADLVNDRTNPSRFGDGEFEYIEISDIDGASVLVRSSRVPCKDAPSRARKLVAAGDVLISTVRPERKAIGIVPPWLDGAVCSTGIAVLRPKKVHPLVLARVMQTGFVNLQLLRNNIGIAYPAFDEACLPKVILPLKQAAMAKLATMADSVATVRNQLADLEKNFDVAVAAAVET